jgi:membrane protein DedA with SNARE-associated domain
MNWLRTIIALAGGTLVSEDLTCIAAGHLVRLEQVESFVAIAGCAIGIFVGDLGLWLIGRLLGRRVIRAKWIAGRVTATDLDQFGCWFDRNAAAAILGSRFIPGARVPMYLAAGSLGRKPLAFFGWTLVAALMWTPLIVFGTAALGQTLARPLQAVFGNRAVVLLVAATISFAILSLPRLLIMPNLRTRVLASVSRIWRWEFWPAWLFYLPLIPWIAWLALRHRSFMVITAANPGIPHGGIVGESKFNILSHLAGPHVLPSRLVSSIEQLADVQYPIVLKPNAGQRGAGVRIVGSRQQAVQYLAQNPGPVLAQEYHPGPFEAGIFYYRIPGEPRGRIFSITDKRFPVLVGDGVYTISELIWHHPRFRMQAATFFARHRDKLDAVLARGEELQLARAGNHCQGTMFRDGGHLITPELEAAIDSIARRFEGFSFGRFDVRYSDVEAFKAGKDFAVVELNGATSESTNLYDPDRSIFWAYRTLYSQWALLFEIASAARQDGVVVSRLRDVAAEVIRFYRGAQAARVSD